MLCIGLIDRPHAHLLNPSHILVPLLKTVLFPRAFSVTILCSRAVRKLLILMTHFRTVLTHLSQTKSFRTSLESGCKYWATRLSVRSHRSLIRLLCTAGFARALHCPHSFVRSLTYAFQSSWKNGFCLSIDCVDFVVLPSVRWLSRRDNHCGFKLYEIVTFNS